MPKKHYNAIARIITEARRCSGSEIALDHVTLELAEMLQQDNPRFDFNRFVLACGLIEPKPQIPQLIQWAGEDEPITSPDALY